MSRDDERHVFLHAGYTVTIWRTPLAWTWVAEVAGQRLSRPPFTRLWPSADAAERCAIRVIDRGHLAATKPIPKGGNR